MFLTIIVNNTDDLIMPVATLKCKQCGEYQKREKVIKTPFGKFCCKEHAEKFAMAKCKRDSEKKLNKAKQAQVKKEKTNKKAVTELNRKSVKWQHAKTQPVFNKLRRLQELKWFADRGLEPVCISCQKPIGGDQWCNGHFKSVGSNGRLRYDFKNSYLQHNRSCNMAKSGDIEGYKIGLVERFGSEKGLEIIGYCEESNAPKKWTWQELEESRKEFNRQIRELI